MTNAERSILIERYEFRYFDALRSYKVSAHRAMLLAIGICDDLDDSALRALDYCDENYWLEMAAEQVAHDQKRRKDS